MPHSIRSIQNGFDHFLVYKPPHKGTWSRTKWVKLSHWSKRATSAKIPTASKGSNRTRARAYLYNLHIFVHNEDGPRALRKKFRNFSSGKSFYCELKGELVSEWGGLSYVHCVHGQAACLFSAQRDAGVTGPCLPWNSVRIFSPLESLPLDCIRATGAVLGPV